MTSVTDYHLPVKVQILKVGRSYVG